MPSVSKVHGNSAAPHKFVPSEKEIQKIRAAIDNGADLADEPKAPKPVATYATALGKKEGDKVDSINTQSFNVGGVKYYAVSADNEGNGYTNILDGSGHFITSYSYSESEGPTWDSSPKEAQTEAALAKQVDKLLPRASLGTSKLASMEVKASALPKTVQDQWAKGGAGVKDQHFYKLKLGGQDAFAVYTLYKNPTDQAGFVYLFDTKGSVIGSATLDMKGSSLKYGMSVGRTGA